MKTLLCFGDSNTHGTMPMADMADRRRYAWEARWPGVAAGRLGPDWRVIEEGHPGRTTVFDDPTVGEFRNGVRVLPSMIESHRPLDVVAIMLGSNDCKTLFSATPLDVAFGLGRLVQVIRSLNNGSHLVPPKILLIAPVPILEIGWLSESLAGAAAKSQALSEKIADLAAREGTGFLDAATVAEVDPGDGLHLTEASHRALGIAVAKAVTDL